MPINEHFPKGGFCDDSCGPQNNRAHKIHEEVRISTQNIGKSGKSHGCRVRKYTHCVREVSRFEITCQKIQMIRLYKVRFWPCVTPLEDAYQEALRRSKIWDDTAGWVARIPGKPLPEKCTLDIIERTLY